MANSTPLKIHEVSWVSPPPETAATSLPFTFFDLLWIRLPPVERLFFYSYPHDSSSFFHSVLPNLKHSLSLTLHHFSPLAGNITWSRDSPYPIINYLPGDSVPFTVAESHTENFNHLCSNLSEVTERHRLVPRLNVSHEQASILALQVTVFPNYGFCIGITTHHAAVDGKSSTLFLKSWAYICSQLITLGPVPGPSPTLPEELKPSFDRSVIRDTKGISQVYASAWLNYGGESNNRSLKVWDSINTTQNDAVKGIFELTPSHIQKLKQHAQSRLKTTRVSSFAVTCAYLLSCAVKVDEPKSNSVAFVFSVDCRARLDPPISKTYFGNCIVSQMVKVETEEVLGSDGFVKALEEIINVLNGLENGVLNEAENWMKKIQSVMGDRLFSLAGSPRFEVYGVDFGWGKPKKVDVTSVDKTGAFSLSESGNGDGGIEVGLALRKEQMEAFSALFVQGLESL